MYSRLILVACALSFAAALLEAAPGRRLQWSDLLPSNGDGDSVGDIWTDCGKPGDKGKIVNITIVPDPPKKGEDVAVTATFSLDEVVKEGSGVKVYLAYASEPLIDETFDLCQLASMVGLSCPIAAGMHTIKINEEIPDFIPSGAYTGNGTAFDQNKNELGCIKINATLN